MNSIERALSALNGATSHFQTNPFALTFAAENDVSFLKLPKDSPTVVYAGWKPGVPHKFPSIIKRGAYGKTFSLASIYQLLLDAGATPDAAIQMLIALAIESGYQGKAKAQSSSATGLFQGLQGSKYRPVLSEDLYDHLPAAKYAVVASKLKSKTIDLKTLYALHFTPAALQGSRVDSKKVRGSVFDNTTWGSQYLVSNGSQTWNDWVFATLVMWYKYLTFLTDEAENPFQLIVMTPMDANHLIYVRRSRSGNWSPSMMFEIPASPTLVKATRTRHDASYLASIPKGFATDEISSSFFEKPGVRETSMLEIANSAAPEIVTRPKVVSGKRKNDIDQRTVTSSVTVTSSYD